MNCGYTGIISDNKKDVMTRSVVLHSTMRLIPMLDQLRKGLQLYGLLRVLHINADICLPLFVSGEDDGVDAAFIIQKCHPEYSEKGSVRYTREVNIMNFFQDFLQDIEDQDDLEAEVEDGHKKLTVGRVMQWITGQGHKPCLPSEKADFKISFTSDSHSSRDVNWTYLLGVSLCMSREVIRGGGGLVYIHEELLRLTKLQPNQMQILVSGWPLSRCLQLGPVLDYRRL
uniref:Uncharacterized protein n=1 Tax=Knipowitschia caucasica TaxID=637954 RepID=A0AAV2MI06_KNICA